MVSRSLRVAGHRRAGRQGKLRVWSDDNVNTFKLANYESPSSGVVEFRVPSGPQFLIVTATLAVINAATYHHYWWFLWIAFGWGSGVLAHGLKVFDRVPFLNGEWERRQVEKQLGRKL